MPLWSRRRAAGGPLAPGGLAALLALVLVVVVGVVALVTRQQPPPTVAEYAPQAVAQIRHALANQAGVQAGAPRPASAPQSPPPTAPAPKSHAKTPSAKASPAATPPPIIEHNLLDCVGTPARQTEDPQSPPCNPYWSGNNGGATYPGVTATTITIAYPVDFFENTAIPPLLAQFFNRRYEFYGRKIVLKQFTPNTASPATLQADAIKVAKMPAFASLGYANDNGAEGYYYDELAKYGVISSAYRAVNGATEAHYAAEAPYEWNAETSVDNMMTGMGHFVCTQLAGKPPTAAGPPINGDPKRVFGLIVEHTPDGSGPPTSDLTDILASCGVHPVTVQETDGVSNAEAENDMVKFSQDKVTSVICLCEVGDTRGAFMPAATAEGYEPEWVVSSYIDQDLDNSYAGGAGPPDQADHVIGLDFRNKFLPYQDMPWYWALRQVDPGYAYSTGDYYSANSRYEQLALLAAGIQLAGPHLTPQSFQAGLFAAQFPNPGAGGPPYYQARVGFPGGRHSMTNSESMIWYSATMQGTVNPTNPGAVCYVYHGQRIDNGDFTPGNPPFQQGSCL